MMASLLNGRISVWKAHHVGRLGLSATSHRVQGVDVRGFGQLEGSINVCVAPEDPIRPFMPPSTSASAALIQSRGYGGRRPRGAPGGKGRKPRGRGWKDRVMTEEKPVLGFISQMKAQDKLQLAEDALAVQTGADVVVDDDDDAVNNALVRRTESGTLLIGGDLAEEVDEEINIDAFYQSIMNMGDAPIPRDPNPLRTAETDVDLFFDENKEHAGSYAFLIRAQGPFRLLGAHHVADVPPPGAQGKLKLANDTLNRAVKRGFESLEMYNSLLAGYSAKGDILGAKRVMKRIYEGGVTTKQTVKAPV